MRAVANGSLQSRQLRQLAAACRQRITDLAERLAPSLSTRSRLLVLVGLMLWAAILLVHTAAVLADIAYSYDAAGRLTAMTITNGNTQIQATYTYDPVGNILGASSSVTIVPTPTAHPTFSKGEQYDGNNVHQLTLADGAFFGYCSYSSPLYIFSITKLDLVDNT